MTIEGDRLQYRLIVAQFREITGLTHEQSGRCCRLVRDGSPECCYQIADGADLTFTEYETMLIGWPRNVMVEREDGMLVLDRGWWSPSKILTSTWMGALANTLECASHPTRPVLDEGRVIAVVVINGCNADIGLGQYVVQRDRLLSLWQRAVDLTGPKPYYGVPGRLKPDWTVL